MMKNNIYKYINSLQFKNINKSKNNKNVTYLFDDKKYVYKNINNLYLENNVSKLKKVEYLIDYKK